MYQITLRQWACHLGVLLCWIGFSVPLRAQVMPAVLTQSNAVGRVAPYRYFTPTGQWLMPAGRQVELPGLRPQALALGPDGKLLATSGRLNKLYLIDPRNGRILQKLSLSTNQLAASAPTQAVASVKQVVTNRVTAPVTSTNKTSTPNTSDSALSLTGLVFSPNGRRIFVATVAGTIRVFAANPTGQWSSFATWPIPEAKAPKQKREIPAGLAISGNGCQLYVVGNLGNKLHELDAGTGKVLRSWDTGVAPYDVVLAGKKAYVSNLGGRRPIQGDVAAPAGRGTTVRVDPVRFIANEGSVTVIDLHSGCVTAEIAAELHASALAVSPDRRYVVVANTGSDTLSVIDTQTDWVVEKIGARQSPADLFGAQPNALTFDEKGKRLFVCNGTQNAVAVIDFRPQDRMSSVQGLIPVGWFPGAIAYDARRNTLCVANIKGQGALKVFKPGEKVKLSSKDFYGTVSLVPLPSKRKLAELTRIARANMSYPKLAEAFLPPRAGQPLRPVPERVGEPSVFKHVIYVIKENRSYDQVLGDMKEGNGNAELCTFGEKYTPNQHKIAREFVLLDNTYCSGVQSADGHQWTDSAIVNEYVERQLTADFPRSYSSGKTDDGLDALAWSSSGFLWDNAVAHGKSFRNYGEWMMSQADWRDKKGHKNKPLWRDFWRDFTTGTNLTRVASWAGIKSLRGLSNTNTVGWDLAVPDVWRAAEFIKELRQFEATGKLPNLVLIFLPNDHTGGTKGQVPVPGAQIADNDLALGQIVEAISHSKFWPETCLFAIEDDPQAGWDHVSGYRTTCYVVSPYTKRAQTVSTPYNQTSLVRTIELILGLPPMNQMDATAVPMNDCFTETSNYAPFLSVPNTVPLDQINPEPKKVANRILRQDAILSAKLPLEEPDRCPEDLLNHILWRAMKGPDVPYPDWAVTAVRDDD